MKVGFYLQNKGIKDVDCSNPLLGNPGIGGTEYLFTAIPYAIQTKIEKCQDKDYEITVITDIACKLPENIKQVVISDNLDNTLQEERIDLVVIRYSLENYNLVKSLNGETKVIMWAHNFIRRFELSMLAKDDRIVTIVCVGSEQINFYRDHSAFYKSVVIYNGYPIDHFASDIAVSVNPFESRDNEVVFLGNLVEYKGFHLLAEAWKTIISQVPDAHLNVIGGGKLYDRNQKLGKWGIAEETYEAKFMPYLIGEDGKILSSVTFHGVMGHEKAEILNKAKVGVPNPSGISETFCIAALEMQLWGAVIATINYGGFKDTVYKTGILYDSPAQLAESVIRLLKNGNNDYKEFVEFSRKFDFDTVANDWIRLFEALKVSEDVSNVLKPRVTKEYRIAEWNRRIKRILPFGKYLPSSMFYQSVFRRIGNKSH